MFRGVLFRRALRQTHPGRLAGLEHRDDVRIIDRRRSRSFNAVGVEKTGDSTQDRHATNAKLEDANTK